MSFNLPESPIATLPNNVIETILNELSNEDRKQARLINRLYEFAFGYNRNIQNYVFTVDGTTKASGYTSLQTLVNSSIRWRHIRFRRFQLEDQLFGNEVGFIFFTRTYCPTLSSLTFQQCKMRMGRFIELLTFCENLTHLHIIHCSSLFHTSFEISYWVKCFEKFFERVESLQGLEIVDQNNMLTEEALMPWTSKMKKLQSLKIHSGQRLEKSRLPKFAISRAIQNNKVTLTELDISGPSSESPTLWELILKQNCVPSRLEVLKVQKVKLHPVIVFNQILCQFKNLKHLNLDHVSIPELCFTNMNEFSPLLEFVTLKFCTIHPLILDCLSKCINIKSVVFANNVSATEDAKILNGYRHFFQRTVALLEDVTFMAFMGAYIIPFILANTPCLKSLDISQMKGIKRSHLLCLRSSRIRRTLRCLIMKGCDVDDDTFVGSPSFLSELSALETLDLAETQVGDGLVLDCVTRLRKLDHLDLSLTKVSQVYADFLCSPRPKKSSYL